MPPKPSNLPAANPRWSAFRSFLLVLLLMAGPSFAADEPETTATATEGSEDRVDALEEKVDILAEEVGRLESIFAVPEELALESFSGLGPAASKVYKRDKGLSIGGYGEVRLRQFVNRQDDNQDSIFDALRAVVYVGYKFNENWVFNSELEFEHGGTGGGGSVSSEFVTVDYLHSDEFNIRAGLVLVPMGFVNEIHESNFFFGAERPEVERQIIPSTWRENGAGFFGTIADRVHYRVYAINSFDGQDFSSSGLRGGRQSGSRALSNDFAFVGRVDVDLIDGLQVGGSVFTGQTGQEQTSDTGIKLPDAHLTIYEVHGQYKRYGLSLRALWTQALLDEAGALSRALAPAAPTASSIRQGIAGRMDGLYVEAGYDILPLILPETKMSLEPYFRYERYDTQKSLGDGFIRDGSKDINLYVAGLQYKPIPQVVFKLDYRRFDPREGDRADEVQALVGYVF
jgi:hypothetical protein